MIIIIKQSKRSNEDDVGEGEGSHIKVNVPLSSKTSCSEEDFTSLEPLQAVKGHSIVDEIRKVDFTL